MEDIELHDAARIKTIIDKGGHCNASQSDVTRVAILSKKMVSIVIMYLISITMHTMEADIHDFQYVCVFLV